VKYTTLYTRGEKHTSNEKNGQLFHVNNKRHICTTIQTSFCKIILGEKHILTKKPHEGSYLKWYLKSP
jgi:hypothetical protein